MPYKRRPGYTLKKGKSGERRWHKNPSTTLDIVARNETNRAERHKRELEFANKVLPGINQHSFKMTPEELNLDVDPDTFYGNGSRLVLPSRFGSRVGAAPDVMYHGTRYDFDDFIDSANNRPINTGHWNVSLGNHLTNDRSVAETFAGTTMYSGVDRRKGFRARDRSEGGRIIEAVTDIKNPLGVADELILDNLAAAYMVNKVLSKRQRNRVGAEIDSYLFEEIEKVISASKNDKDAEIEIAQLFNNQMASPSAIYQALIPEDGLKSNREVVKAGERFKKDRIIPAGYDGMVYKNFVETGQGGDYGIIPFSAKQIRLTHGERKSHEELLLEHDRGGSKRWDYIDYSDEMGRALHEHEDMESVYPKSEREDLSLDSRFKTVNRFRELLNQLRPSGSDIREIKALASRLNFGRER